MSDKATPVSVDQMDVRGVADLEAEIADLKRQLAESNAKRDEAETFALQAAEAQGMMQENVQEVPTGKTKGIPKCVGYRAISYKENGQPNLRPIWDTMACPECKGKGEVKGAECEDCSGKGKIPKLESVPTYFYKIMLPPSGGYGLMVNQQWMYHGGVYELDIHQLRSAKEQVFRSWQHEKNVHGDNENFYKRETKPTISARAF